MSKPTKLIKEICPASKNWSVKVMVVEKTMPRQSQHNPMKYQRLILIDSEGTRIQGSILGNDIELFKDTLIISKSYRISNAFVKPIKPEHRIVDNDYQWIINGRTLVQEIVEEKLVIPSTFSFVSFSDLEKYKDTDAQVDIIALAIDAQPAREIRTKKGLSMIQEIIVIDQELKPMLLTFWDQFVTNEAAKIIEVIRTKPIIIAAHLKVASYNGISLATKAASSFIINPKTAEAMALHSWSVLNEIVLGDIIRQKSYLNSASSSTTPSKEDVIEIAKIESLLPTQMNFWVIASMTVKNLNQKFWYMSCNQCNKVTGAEYDELFVCIYCKRQNVRATPRCCVEVELEDASGSISGTLFGKNAEKVLSCSAKQLMEQTDEDGITDIESVATLSNPDNFIIHIKATTYERQGQTKNKFSVVEVSEIPQ